MVRRRVVHPGQGSGRNDDAFPATGTFVDADTIHSTLGLTFTALWLLIGRVILGDRV